MSKRLLMWRFTGCPRSSAHTLFIFNGLILMGIGSKTIHNHTWHCFNFLVWGAIINLVVKNICCHILYFVTPVSMGSIVQIWLLASKFASNFTNSLRIKHVLPFFCFIHDIALVIIFFLVIILRLFTNKSFTIPQRIRWF